MNDLYADDIEDVGRSQLHAVESTPVPHPRSRAIAFAPPARHHESPGSACAGWRQSKILNTEDTENHGGARRKHESALRAQRTTCFSVALRDPHSSSVVSAFFGLARNYFAIEVPPCRHANRLRSNAIALPLDLLAQHLQSQPLLLRRGQRVLRVRQRLRRLGKPRRIAPVETRVGQPRAQVAHFIL